MKNALGFFLVVLCVLVGWGLWHDGAGHEFDLQAFHAAKDVIERDNYYQVITPVSGCAIGSAMGQVSVRTWKGGGTRQLCCCVVGKVVDVTEWPDAQAAFRDADLIDDRTLGRR